MKNSFLTLVLISFSAFAFAQNVGINTTGAVPNTSAALDIDYPDKGLLIPRVSLTSTTDVATVPAPATSLLVYNTNAAMTGGALGYWYWDGSAWVQAIGPAGPTGAAGATGAQGPIGLTGPAGTNGTNGATGAQGPIGLTGPAGAAGATGAQGPIGLTGPAGTNGTNGATGAQGPIGLTGSAGTNGTNGTNGAVGATGAQGPIGLTGAVGPQGPMGPSWTLTTPTYNTNGTITVNGTAGSGGPVTSTAAAWLTTGNAGIAAANFIGSTNSADLKFRTNNTERMSIEANGWIGIKTTAPTSMLQMTNGGVNVGANAMASYDNAGTDGVALSGYNTSTTDGYNAIEGITNYSGSAFLASGVFGLAINGAGTSSAIGVRGSTNGDDGYGVYGSRVGTGINGWGGVFVNDLGYTGFFGAASDKRLKKDIKQLDGALSIIQKLNPVTYHFNQEKYPLMGLNTEKEYGFIAQEIKEILPEIVREKNLPINGCEKIEPHSIVENKSEKFLTMDYTRIIPILTKAIQEQQAIIEKLEKRIEILENK